MKKYLKMTFAALSAIALNFSCLATYQPPRHHYSGIRTYNKLPNIHHLNPTPLYIGEQISLLKRAILTGKVSLAENIFTGHIGKIGPIYYRTQKKGCLGKIGPIYYRTQKKGRFYVPMSDQQFEELQLFSLYYLRHSNHGYSSFDAKLKIFELITAKFFEVTNNQEQAYQTTTCKIYKNLNRFGFEELSALIDLFPSPISKRDFAEQFLNYAKLDNNIDAYEKIFCALETLPFVSGISTSFSSFLSIFKNQPWLLQFISEYLEQALCNTDVNLIPIYFIKEVAPDLYNEKFPTFLKKCITDDAPYEVIDTLLPLDKNNLPLAVRRLSPEYLNLALKESHEGDIISSHIASYTDTSSNLKDVALTLASFTQKKRQDILEDINDTNSVLYHSLLEALQSLEH